MAFHSRTTLPTGPQYQAIGRVAATWSIVEFALEEILARLSYAPPYLGRALTNDLSIDNRLGALRNLCDIHELQLGHSVVPAPLVEHLREAEKEIARHKQKRNQVVHYVWFRDTDERMFGMRFRSKPAWRTGGPHTMFTVDEINEFADEIEALSTRLLDVSKQLPDVALPSP